MNAQTGIINIRGKEYQTVALRVQLFRESFPLLTLESELIARDDDCVVMKARIADENGRTLATGHAEEKRSASQINRTSALENAETSAFGRALAAFGYGGTEFATANEVANAIHQQGAGGQSSERAVSPPRTKLAGPYTSPTALQTAIKAFVHELNGVGDGDELSAFLHSKDSLALIEQVKRDKPDWWHGSPDMPAEFVPLGRTIELKEYEMAQQVADLARA